jgi:cytochrome c biogenesis protein CcdA
MMASPTDQALASGAREDSSELGTAALILVGAIATAGVLLLVYFTSRMLMVGRLGLLSLPLMAVVGGVASAFNPCALPALPGFLMFCGGPRQPLRQRAAIALAAGGGAFVVVTAILGVVAVLGMEAQLLVAPKFGGAQVCFGLVMILLAAAHLLGMAPRLPLVDKMTAAGSRLWDAAVERPNPSGAFLFGAGFLAVGGT